MSVDCILQLSCLVKSPRGQKKGMNTIMAEAWLGVWGGVEWHAGFMCRCNRGHFWQVCPCRIRRRLVWRAQSSQEERRPITLINALFKRACICSEIIQPYSTSAFHEGGDLVGLFWPAQTLITETGRCPP